MLLRPNPKYVLPALIGVNGLLVLLVAQTSDFQSNLNGIRSLRSTVWNLQQKTGWHICVEEPVWDSRPAGGVGAKTSIRGVQIQPPDPDRLQISVPTLRGTGAKPATVAALLAAFDRQNSSVRYKTETLGDFTIFEADAVRSRPGSFVPARLILSTPVTIPVAQRTPSEHLAALIGTIQNNMPRPPRILLDTGLFPLDKNFTGKNLPGAQPQDQLLRWGTTSTRTARQALVDLLSKSKTTFDWQVACQVGINSAGECTLSLRPTTVNITARSGKQVVKEILFDRGRPDLLPPPEPPQ